MTEPPDPDHAADGGLAMADRSERVRVQVTGPDRVPFLHNLTTNDVRRLGPGQGCEAFVTSPQGKTLGYVSLHAAEDHILLRADAGALDELAPHFQKYGVFDDASWVDLTGQTFELHLVGPRLPELLDRLPFGAPPADDLGLRSVHLGDRPFHLIREAPTGRPGVTLIGDRDALAELTTLLHQADENLGLIQLDPSTFDLLRIEAGTPVFGRDITPANLPQEVDRNERAISFQKGCYLGQETVARIDALGHVNKLLRGLQFDPGAVPSPGTALIADGKPVGAVTSAAASPRFGCPIGLGYVRRTHAAIGSTLELEPAGSGRSATVVALPMRPTTADDGR